MWLVPNSASLRTRGEDDGAPDELDTDEHVAEYEEDEEEDHRVAHLLSDHRQLACVAAVFVLGVVAIYLVLPKVVGFDESLDRIDDAKWYWVVVAVGFCVAQFGAYVALFRGVLGGRSDSEVRRRLDIEGVLPDHHGRAGGHAHLLGGGRRRHRADLLGAAQGGHAAAPLGLPDGRLPGAARTRSTWPR